MPFSGLFISNWYSIIVTFNGNQLKLFIDGILVNTLNQPGAIQIGNDPLRFGRRGGGGIYDQWYNGTLDDIGIWNRALTQQEITNLYNSINCANNLSLTPANNPLVTGSTANFTATTSDPNPVYQWQTNPANVGWMNVQNNSTYNASAGNLSVSNVQLANHQQAFRVISTSGNCVDTSNLALLTITDTCINTINDTNFITVTDTLLINAVLTGINPPNNQNTIKVFPNPANTHITIDYGNFASMNGYQLKITNSLSQQVFLTSINQQSNYIDLSTWSGNGIYFVHLIDPQGNTVDIRKIVLQ